MTSRISPYLEDQIQAHKELDRYRRLAGLPFALALRRTELRDQLGRGSHRDPTGNIYNNPSYVAANAPAVNESSGVITPGPTYNNANGLLFNSGTSTGLPVNFSRRRPWYFAPDAGFAWDVRGDGKTSLRGGFGMSYTRIFTNQDCSFNCIANPPVLTSQNLTNLVFPSTSTWNITAAGGTAKAYPSNRLPRLT